MPNGKAEPMFEVIPYNFDKLQEKYSGAREVMLGKVNQALRQCGNTLVPPIKKETPVGATAKLRNTTVYQILGKAEDMRMEVRQSAASKKGFKYGIAVRMGTRPHFPPIDALVPWVVKKLNVPMAEARSVAFLVCRKISRKGTKAQPYHLKVFKAYSQKIRSILRRGVADFAGVMNDVPPPGGA